MKIQCIWCWYPLEAPGQGAHNCFTEEIRKTRLPSQWHAIANPHTSTTKQSEVKDNVALAHPYQVGKSCGKFAYILPSGLGENIVMDGQTDRWMDGGIHNITITFLKSVRINIYVDTPLIWIYVAWSPR